MAQVDLKPLVQPIGGALRTGLALLKAKAAAALANKDAKEAQEIGEKVAQVVAAKVELAAKKAAEVAVLEARWEGVAPVFQGHRAAPSQPATPPAPGTASSGAQPSGEAQAAA